MRRHRSRRKLSLWTYYALLTAFGVLLLGVTAWLLSGRFEAFFTDYVRRVLADRAGIVAARIENADDPIPALATACRLSGAVLPIRITVIAADGRVQCDSRADPATMDNHRRRPEIVAALAGGYGTATRYSATLKTDLMYVAVRAAGLRGVAVVRTALPLAEVYNWQAVLLRWLAGVAFALLAIALLLSLYLYRRINPPIAEMIRGARRFADGHFERKLPDYEVKEIARLADSMNEMAARLERLEQVRRDFVANVSHELKTPITSIKGFVETLRSGAGDDADDLARFLAIIARQSDRLAAIVDDLLTLARLESAPRGEVLHLERQPLAAIVESAGEACLARAQEKGIAITIHCPAGAAVLADHSLLGQALVNLLDNAVKYSPANTRIMVRARLTSNAVTIEVIDQGPGIDASHLPRLFERFYRVDKARSRSIGGTGLGLAIAKHIVSLHGGSVAVDSRFGHGSTFRIELPA